MAVTDIDERKLEAFIGLVATEIGAAANAALVRSATSSASFRAMADGQPVSSGELAARTGTQERYVREWLAAQAASGFLELGEDGYVLPPEHALVLADETSPFAMIGAFQSAGAAIKARERVAERFVTGDGLGWHEHHHGLFHGVERAFAAGYRAYLVDEWLPALDGVVERLQDGGLVADVGCGHGISTVLMAQAFPASRFVGIDYHAESIATARERAAEAGVADRVTFEIAGAGEIPGLRLRPRRVLRRVPRPRRPARRGAQRRLGAGPGRPLHARRALRRRPRAGQPAPDRPLLLRDVDARLHARVAVAARPRGARHPGGRGAPGRGAARGRLRRGPARRETPLNIVLEARLG